MSASSSRTSGWVALAGWLLIILGAVDVLEGVIAVARQTYYVFTPNQIIVFDVKTWGWVTLIVGALIAFAGVGVLSRNAVARWFAIVLLSLNVIEQLAFLGNSAHPFLALISIAITGAALYGLIARWDAGQPAT